MLLVGWFAAKLSASNGSFGVSCTAAAHLLASGNMPRALSCCCCCETRALLTCAVACPVMLRAGTRDVHSPGLPRDCAALEANEADLSALLSNAASSVCSSDGSSAAGAAGSSSGGTAAKDSGAGAASCDDNEVEKALARLQEVRQG